MRKAALGFAFLVFAVNCTVTILVTARLFTPTGDEPHYLVIAHSLAMDRDISLLNNYRERHYRIFYPGLLAKRTTASGDKKLEYPTFGMGMPLFLSPFYKLAYTHFPDRLVLFLRLVICAIAAVGIYHLLQLLESSGIEKKAAAVVVGGAVLSSPLITYSSQFYPEIFAFLLLVVALRSFQSIRESIGWNLILLSLIPGMLPWLHPKYLLLAVLILLITTYYLYRRTRRFSMIQAVHVLVTVAILSTFFVFLQTKYGSWSPNRIYGGWQKQTNLWELLTQEGMSRVWVMGRMFLGFWVDERFGILVYAPMYATFFSAVVWIWRKQREKIFPAMILFTLHFLAMCWGAPLGGYAPPTRHFVVMLPLILLPIAMTYGSWNREQKLLFLTLGGAGIITGIRMLANYRKIFANVTWRNPDGGSEFWSFFHMDRWIPSLTATTPEVELILIWILVVTFLSLLLYPQKKAGGQI